MADPVRVEAEDLRQLVADLKELADGKAQVKALRKALTAAAVPVQQQVRANASWSSRIPAAVGSRARFTAKKVGVSVYVNRRKAPHARPIENDGQAGTFLHPLFGRPRQVPQRARPFFFDETASHMPQVEQAVAEAMEEAARSAGFR